MQRVNRTVSDEVFLAIDAVTHLSVKTACLLILSELNVTSLQCGREVFVMLSGSRVTKVDTLFSSLGGLGDFFRS